MKKIAAFTFIELTIAMVLSSLIIGVAGFAFANVDQSLRSARDRYTETVGIMQLQALLNRDCLDATMVLYLYGELEFTRQDQSIVHYKFESDMAIRLLENQVDTFSIDLQDLRPSYFNDQPPCIESLDILIGREGGMEYTLMVEVNYMNKEKFSLTENPEYDGN